MKPMASFRVITEASRRTLGQFTCADVPNACWRFAHHGYADGTDEPVLLQVWERSEGWQTVDWTAEEEPR